MITENLSTLKIYKLTQEQYNQRLASGNIDETALYLTPDEEIDLSSYATIEYVDEITSDMALVEHNHDDRYYTETEVNTLLSNKADASHIHNDIYYTEDEIDEKFVTINTSISNVTTETKSYTNNLVAQKSQVQIVTWEDDD